MQAETDHGLALRGGVIALLKADPAVSARVGDRIYGGQPPTDPAWPFIRVDISDSLPEAASGWTGEESVWTANGFTRPSEDHPDAEAEARQLAKAIKRAFANGTLQLELEEGEGGPVPEVIEVEVRATNVGVDRDTPGAYHARVEFRSLTAEEA